MKITNDNLKEIEKKVIEDLARGKSERDSLIRCQRYLVVGVDTPSGQKDGDYPFCTECDERFDDDAEAIAHVVRDHISEDEEIAIRHALVWVMNNQREER